MSIQTVKCPKCGIDNPEESRFCKKCRTSLVVKCPNPKCNVENSINYKFCGACGLPLQNPEQTLPPLQPPPLSSLMQTGVSGDKGAFVTSSPSSTPGPSVVAEQAICYVCQKGILQLGKRLFMATDSILKCDNCKTEYHRDKNRWILQQIPLDSTRWRRYEDEVLNDVELARISQGGQSDAEIAAQAEAKRQEEVRQAEEKRVRETPGTPQYYDAKFKRIVGMAETEDTVKFSVAWTSKSEARQYSKRFTQMQKELRQLKRDINGTIKEIHFAFQAGKSNVRADGWATSLFGFDTDAAPHQRAMKRANLRQQELQSIAHYQPMLKTIDNAILALDNLKVEIDRKLAGVSLEAMPTDAFHENKKEESEVQKAKNGEEEPARTSEQIINELNDLTGLESVKHEFQEFVNLLKVQKIRQSKGLPTPPLSLHVVFYGNPGTGKTTVARLLASLYQSLGFLGTGHLVETDRAGLVAGYVGQTAIKVNSVISKALGGVLFIDEAYALAPHGDEDYGAEAIEALLKQMEDHREDLAVIAAGYPDNMEVFLSSNPGLRSRFGRYLHFDDYTPPQLLAIFDSFCTKDGFRLTNVAREKLATILQAAYDTRDKGFGNARLVRNLFEAAVSNQANRIVQIENPSKEVLSIIDVTDLDFA
jgi:ATPase family associated with various cellular activities (AAA)/AAA lid domain/Double zinc ribbon